MERKKNEDLDSTGFAKKLTPKKTKGLSALLKVCTGFLAIIKKIPQIFKWLKKI